MWWREEVREGLLLPLRALGTCTDRPLQTLHYRRRFGLTYQLVASRYYYVDTYACAHIHDIN